VIILLKKLLREADLSVARPGQYGKPRKKI